jgi:hypothetical protein
MRSARRSRRDPRRKTMVLLEHTRGQGRTLGYRFEHLAAIIDHVNGSPRVGVCLDTCHLVASGYDIVSDGRLSRHLRRVRSHRRPRSARRCFTATTRSGRAAAASIATSTSVRVASVSRRFRRLLHDRRFSHLSILIETEKAVSTTKPGSIAVDRYDMQNLDTLRDLRMSDVEAGL